MLINKQLWFADPETFNDPFDCRVDYKAALNKAIDKLDAYEDLDIKKISSRLSQSISKARICCFCETKKNQLMWAHYTDEHKGFCIGFNVNDLLSNGNNITTGILPVKYTSIAPYEQIAKDLELLRGNILNSELSEAFLRSALATKYTGWKYEKEVRLISTKIKVLDFLPKSINSITFGLRMKDKDKQTLKQLLSGQEWNHIKWYETNKAQDRYALSFNLIKQASNIKQYSNV